MKQTDDNKKAAGEAAAAYVKDGMTIGLGSGSTVNWMLKKLAERMKEGLDVKGIPTSKKTERLAKELGIPLTDFSAVEKIDLAIDGADEVDGDWNLLKGGGGSLVREKVVDAVADKFIVIADETKIVDRLGAFPLPVEVLPFGWQLTAKRLEAFGCKPVLRKKDNEIFISDNGNYVLDCPFGSIEKPGELHERLKLLLGVVDTGLFIEMADMVITVRNGKVEELH